MGWSWKTLDELREPDRPIVYGIIKPGPHVPDGVPYVRVTEMKTGTIDPVDSLRRAAPARAALFERASLRSGDILISKDGTIGRVALVPPELEGGNITQHVVRLTLRPELCRDYIVTALRSPWPQRWLSRETRGVALQGVNVSDFRRLPLPIPPRHEQEKIQERVEASLSLVSAVLDEVISACRRADLLRSGILAAAYSGKLVVQDPGEEPASVLLERIATEQASNPKVTARRKPRSSTRQKTQA
jgi:type I restriction enzyme S subunit